MPRRKQAGQKQEEQVVVGPVPDGLLDAKGAMKWLCVGRSSFYELVRTSADFPVIRLGRGMVRYDPNALYRWSLRRQEGWA